MSLLLAKFDGDLATRQAVTPLCITPMVEANTPVCAENLVRSSWSDGIAYSRAMIALISFLLDVLVSPFRSKSKLVAENALLRHQVLVLRRKVKGRVPLRNGDRWFFVQLYHWFPSILSVLERFRAKWVPVRVKKTRQNNELEPRL